MKINRVIKTTREVIQTRGFLYSDLSERFFFVFSSDFFVPGLFQVRYILHLRSKIFPSPFFLIWYVFQYSIFQVPFKNGCQVDQNRPVPVPDQNLRMSTECRHTVQVIHGGNNVTGTFSSLFSYQ